MSLDLGHSKGYIQGISSGKAFPSVPELFYICEYLGVTLQEFFSPEIRNPAACKRAVYLGEGVGCRRSAGIDRHGEKTRKESLTEKTSHRRSAQRLFGWDFVYTAIFHVKYRLSITRFASTRTTPPAQGSTIIKRRAALTSTKSPSACACIRTKRIPSRA